jgi:hypothetical protein
MCVLYVDQAPWTVLLVQSFLHCRMDKTQIYLILSTQLDKRPTGSPYELFGRLLNALIFFVHAVYHCDAGPEFIPREFPHGGE